MVTGLQIHPVNELNQNDKENEEGIINLWKNEVGGACAPNIGAPKYFKKILTD